MPKNKNNRIIKTFAFILAAIVIISMLGGIYALCITVFDLFQSNQIENQIQYDSLMSSLDIDLKTANLEIKLGDKLLVSTTNKYVTTYQNNNNIVIKEKKHSLLSKDNNKVIITVPDNFLLDIVEIDITSGSIKIDKLETKRLNLDLGSGTTKINNLLVTDKTKIDCGSGKFLLNNGNLSNLNLDTGLGDTILNAKIIGNSNIETDIGKLELNLIGSLNDYELTIDKGVGSIKLNNESLKDKSVVGTGNNYLLIEGGIGLTSITTSE
ncbi:MAG: DUF4097 family beta strand repeat-containing protein [Bacilli bacterium]